MKNLKIFIHFVLLITSISSCKKQALLEETKNAKIVILSGQNQVDTADFTLREPIIFKVIDSISGATLNQDSIFVDGLSHSNLLIPLREDFNSRFLMDVIANRSDKTYSVKWQLNCAVGTQILELTVVNRNLVPITTGTVTATALSPQKRWEIPCEFGQMPTYGFYRQPNGTTYIGVGTKFFKSIDGSANWQNIVLPKVGSVTKAYALGDKIIINLHSRIHMLNVTEYDDLYLSNDGGNTWKSIGASIDNAIFENIDKIVMTKQGKFLFHRGFSTFVSDDDGTNWRRLVPEAHINFYNDDIGNLFYVDTNQFLYSSQNNGQTWTRNPFSNDFSRVTVFLKVDNSNNLMIVKHSGTGSKIYRSTDAGNSWTNISTTTFQINDLEQVGTRYFARSGTSMLRLDANFNIIDSVALPIDFIFNRFPAVTEKKFVRIAPYIPTLMYNYK